MSSTWGTNTWGSNSWNSNVVKISLSGLSATASLGDESAFNVEGWGRQAYGNSGWGVEYSVEPTGLAATTSLGTVVASQIITVEPTGFEANTNLGSISINSEVTLSGQSATVSLGDSEEFNETGWGRLTWGTADWGEGADELVTPSGIEATSSLGTVVQGIGVPLDMTADPPSGDQLLKFARTSLGTVTATPEEIIPITGVQSDFATPTLSYAGTLVGWGRDAWGDNSWGESPNEIVAVVGRDLTTSVGSISPEDAVGLSGQEATTNLGSITFTIDSTPAITGQEATGDLGTLGLEFGPASISGVSSTFNVGTLGLEFGPPSITGISVTTNVGELTIDDTQIIDITGVQSTSAVGSIVPAIGVPLTGIAATSSVGSITPSDVMGLTGLQATFVDPTIGIQAFANVDTGSNGSYSNVDTGSNSSYSDASTGSNSSYSNVATGSNTSYSDAA